MEQLDEQNREVYEEPSTSGKRKLDCCKRRAKRIKTDTVYNYPCKYCECTFELKGGVRSHIENVHRCRDCDQIIFTKSERAQHRAQHKIDYPCNYCESVFQRKSSFENHMKSVHQGRNHVILTEEMRAQLKNKREEKNRKKEEEERKREEKKRQQIELEKQHQQKDNEMILNYLKTNKLDEFQPDPDYEPDIDYILCKYDLDKEELLRLVKKFNVENIFVCDTSGDLEGEGVFTFEKITFLMENDALSVENVVSHLDCMVQSAGDEEPMSKLVSYFLDKNFEIKREWVAKLIDDDALVERIKQKHAYTFKEIYEAREHEIETMMYLGLYSRFKRKWFYDQVHKHFPDPEFEEPIDDPVIEFKRVTTDHVLDHQRKRYFYDEENDELSIMIETSEGEERVSLGECKEMLEKDLLVLIDEYYEATERYNQENATVSELIEQRKEDLHDELTEKERWKILDHYDYELYRTALPERNDSANIVSKLYFVIAQK